jgi:hypothetical protein
VWRIWRHCGSSAAGTSSKLEIVLQLWFWGLSLPGGEGSAVQDKAHHLPAIYEALRRQPTREDGSWRSGF